MKTGLVLEGGGMRGMFTCGVTDVLMEEGLADCFQGIVGVSAGAAFGCNIKSGQKGRALRYCSRFNTDSRYMSWRNWLRTGNLFHTEFAYDTVPRLLDPFDIESFNNSSMEFHLVCTDIERKLPVYRILHDDFATSMRWIRATAALPIASNPVNIDGKRLLDGGLTDSIPLHYFQQQGYGRNLVVLTQPRGYRKRCTWRTRLWHLLLPHRPKVARLLVRRPDMYNAQLDYLAAQEALGNTLVVCPEKPIGISRLAKEPAQLKAAYDLGRQTARQMLPQIKTFLCEAPK